MVRRRSCAVLSHEYVRSLILRDAAKWPLLRMRNVTPPYARTVRSGGSARDIAARSLPANPARFPGLPALALRPSLRPTRHCPTAAAPLGPASVLAAPARTAGTSPGVSPARTAAKPA